MSDHAKVWEQFEDLQRVCSELAAAEDDAVRMFALRVDAMARALRDSVLVPPDLEGKFSRE